MWKQNPTKGKRNVKYLAIMLPWPKTHSKQLTGYYKPQVSSPTPKKIRYISLNSLNLPISRSKLSKIRLNINEGNTLTIIILWAEMAHCGMPPKILADKIIWGGLGSPRSIFPRSYRTQFCCSLLLLSHSISKRSWYRLFCMRRQPNPVED